MLNDLHNYKARQHTAIVRGVKRVVMLEARLASGRDTGGYTLLGYRSQFTSSLHVYFQSVSHAGKGQSIWDQGQCQEAHLALSTSLILKAGTSEAEVICWSLFLLLSSFPFSELGERGFYLLTP